jgi:creatinine amidohydrolase
MTWTEVADLSAPVVLVPVGSFEQHGPHLPLDTDTRIAEALCDELQLLLDVDSVIAPSIGVSASGEHAGFPGTLSVGTHTTAAVLVEIARSADWARGVVFVNGHGGNADAVAAASRTLHDEGRTVFFWSPTAEATDDAHAGFTETSVMLYLEPELVNMDAAERGNVRAVSGLAEQLRREGVRAVSDNGVLGDPRHANAADGERIFQRWLGDLAATCRRIWPETP